MPFIIVFLGAFGRWNSIVHGSDKRAVSKHRLHPSSHSSTHSSNTQSVSHWVFKQQQHRHRQQRKPHTQKVGRLALHSNFLLKAVLESIYMQLTDGWRQRGQSEMRFYKDADAVKQRSNNRSTNRLAERARQKQEKGRWGDLCLSERRVEAVREGGRKEGTRCGRERSE